MHSGEIIAVVAMLAGAGVAIGVIDWLQRGIPDALGEPWGDEPHLPAELRTPAAEREAPRGGKRNSAGDRHAQDTSLTHVGSVISR